MNVYDFEYKRGAVTYGVSKQVGALRHGISQAPIYIEKSFSLVQKRYSA